MANTDTTYSVNLWGSHPDADNDDCWTGQDYATEAEARQAFADPSALLDCSYLSFGDDVAFIELCKGSDWDSRERLAVKPNPGFKPSADTDDAWRSEQRMQSAMAFGVQGWNDFEGC